MGRRILIVVISLGVTWFAIELWLGSRAPRSSVTKDGGSALSVFEPEQRLVDRWEVRLQRMLAGNLTDNRVVYRFSARYGWANVPGGRGRHGGIQVSFNSIGARGERELGQGVDEGALRLACYGESFTFGSEVDDPDTWPARLAVTAEGALEVLNLGVGGWGTDQALLRFRDTVDDLAPDVVLMGLLSENIARNLNRLRPVYSPGTHEPLVKPRFVLADGMLELLPHPYATEIDLYRAACGGSLGIEMAPHEYWAPDVSSWSNVVEAVRSNLHKKRLSDWWRLWNDPEGEPYQLTLFLLEAFHREAIDAGVRFAGVVLFPTRDDLSREQRRMITLMEDLRARDIPYLELYPLVAERLQRGEPTHMEKGHFTPAANTEVAGAVWTWLVEELEL